jgi:N-methylhydantoinase A
MLTADMRYIGQEYYVNVPIKLPINLEEINKNFHSTYEQQYGHSTPEGPCEFINLRLIAVGKILKSKSMKSIDKKNIKEKSSRKIIFNKKNYETDILDRQIIETNEKFIGPIVIEEETATTVIPPNYSLIKDDYGNLIINKN